MISPSKRLSVILVCFMVLLIPALPGCIPPQQPKAGLNPALSISEPPALGKPVKVTLTFTPQRAIETYTARIELPGGGVYEVIQGDLQRDGMPGSSPRLEITIKALREDVSGVIIGWVRGMTPHVSPWEHVYLWITIDKEGATVSDKQPPPRQAPKRPGSTKPPETPSPAATAGAAPAQKISPSKLGSSISYLASVRGTTRALLGTRQAKVIEMMGKEGGAGVTILFDHVLTPAEIGDLECRNLVKFDRWGNNIGPGPAYSGVVPWQKLKVLSELPEVRVVETGLWPPRVPGLDPIPSANQKPPVFSTEVEKTHRVLIQTQ